MKTLRALSTKIEANNTKVTKLREDNITLINEAIELVNNKIDELKLDYSVTDRKAIKVIQTAMFEPKNKDDKLSAKIKLAIKAVVVAHKRKVFDSILWNDLSINKIDEILKHLTVTEIKSMTSVEDIKPLLDSKKTREVKTLAYDKAKI